MKSKKSKKIDKTYIIKSAYLNPAKTKTILKKSCKGRINWIPFKINNKSKEIKEIKQI